jgi:MFS family permease
MAEAPGPTPRVWDSPRELGSVQSITAVGGTPISVLAGFSLTSAIMVAAARGSVWRDLAVVLFALGAGAFILALGFIVEAVNYAASPDLRLAYNPEARLSERALWLQRKRQREDEWLLDIYNRHIARTTTTGVVSSLLGLGAALLTARVSWGVVTGVVVVTLVAVVTLLNHWGLVGRLFPRPVHVPAARSTPPPLDEVGRAAVLGESRAGGPPGQERPEGPG